MGEPAFGFFKAAAFDRGHTEAFPFLSHKAFPFLPACLPALSLESQCLAQGLTPEVMEEWMGDGWCEGDQLVTAVTGLPRV